MLIPSTQNRTLHSTFYPPPTIPFLFSFSPFYLIHLPLPPLPPLPLPPPLVFLFSYSHWYFISNPHTFTLPLPPNSHPPSSLFSFTPHNPPHPFCLFYPKPLPNLFLHSLLFFSQLALHPIYRLISLNLLLIIRYV